MSLALLIAFSVCSPAAAADKPAPTTATKAAPTATAKKTGREAALAMPRYVQPPAFSEDMVLHTKGKDMLMKRSVDGADSRTEMSFEGQSIVTLQPGDEKGTVYMLMASQKKAMKYTMDAKELANAAAADSNATVPEDFTVEELGEETIDGVVARKMLISTKDGNVTAWFDQASGAPLRMESVHEGEPVSIEWKNRKAGPQDAALFEVPKDYEVTDMTAMMKGMGGMGGVGGAAKGMGAGMVGGMASGMAGGLGSSIGGMLGGPIGAVAGQYIGSKVGGMVSKKATDAIVK